MIDISDKLLRSWTEASGGSAEHPSSARDRKIAQLKAIILLRFSGRIDDLMKHFAEDGEMYIAGGPQFSPLSGRYIGRDQVAAKLRSLNVMFDHLDVEFIRVMVENDDVALRWKCQARDRSVGSNEWHEGMTMLHFRGDLVTYYGNFLDAAVLSRLIDWKRLLSEETSAVT